MPLPSQSGRSKSRRSHMYSRRRRHPLRWIAGAIVSVAIAVGFWWVWPGNDQAEKAGPPLSQTATLDSAERAAPNALPRSPKRDLPAVGTPKTREVTNTLREKTQPQQNTRPTPVEPAKLVMGQPQIKPSTTNDNALPSDRTNETSPQTIQPTRTEQAPALSDVFAGTRNDKPANTADTPGQNLEQTTGPTPAQTSSSAQSTIASALASLESRPVESRLLLTKALNAADVSPADQQRVREALARANETLVFSPSIVPGDPFVIAYNIQSGDLLQKIVRNHSLQVDWRLIARINRVDPRRIRVGQRMKLITGPFHAIVDKSDFRLDLYLGDGSQQVFVRSFKVGLGEFNSTPEGLFRVRPQSKAINPAWVNPRTGEAFEAEDPQNPIGEHWIGLEAVDETLKDVIGYGIHGTTDPASIGQEKSMGCVRLADADIELLYELLVEETSLVRIVR